MSSSSRRYRHYGNGSNRYRQGGLGGMFGAFLGSSLSSSKRRYGQGYGTPYPQQAAPAPQAAPGHAGPVQAAPAGGATTCPQCGTAVPAGSKFCLECGAKMGGGFCGNCGATLPPTGKFCPECGAPRA